MQQLTADFAIDTSRDTQQANVPQTLATLQQSFQIQCQLRYFGIPPKHVIQLKIGIMKGGTRWFPMKTCVIKRV